MTFTDFLIDHTSGVTLAVTLGVTFTGLWWVLKGRLE